MVKVRRVAACLLVLAAVLAAPVCAQERYPSRPITLIVPMSPGGGPTW